MRNKNSFLSLLILTIVLALTGCKKDYSKIEITDENKVSLLEETGIKISEKKLVKGEIPAKDDEVEEQMQFNYELPDISNYEPDVKGEGEIDVEIFLPLENNGSSIRELVKYVSESFNEEQLENKAGQTMSVTIRSLESSLAEDFIKYGTYMPEGYIASNEFYGLLIQSNGINVKEISTKLVGNTMGIAIEKEKYDELMQTYGEVSIDTIVTANIDGNLSIGYTNPTNNPTGLNFVVSMLAYFDESNPYSFEATTDFSNFQNTVSSVSYSTEQMVEKVKKGVINAFVIEHQAYENDVTIESEFVFLPFGVRHDYPLYELDYITDEDEEVLCNFADYFQKEKVQSYAKELNFNQDSEYVSAISPDKYPLSMITEILKFWKENKSSGKQIVAMFVSDVSGSMHGKKIEALKDSLKNAMQYVSEDAKVGLMSFNYEVFNDLPIGKFTKTQQEFFVGAVDSLNADGGTSTNNAILMAIKLINEEQQKSSEEIKPIIILLADGNTGSGYSLNNVENLIKAFDIPIYTIGYGRDADVEELKRIANINGGAFIDASTDDVSYVIKTLFNAEI